MAYDNAMYASIHYQFKKLDKMKRDNERHAKKAMKGLKEDIRQAEALGLSYGEYILRKDRNTN